LKVKVAAPVWKTEITAVGFRRADHATPLLSAKIRINFADKRRSLGQLGLRPLSLVLVHIWTTCETTRVYTD
jgi:hypothetical protein